jgi:ribulose-5-phosphate 4-epimerase/fuculose-1-phosphate aldolase
MTRMTTALDSTPATTGHPAPPNSTDEWSLRVDLAAAFRLAAMNDWHEAVANHFSAAISEDGQQFLINPRWRHFSAVRASELVLMDARDDAAMGRPDAPDPSAWSIHRALHALHPDARVVLHVHPTYSTALACLEDPTILAIDQNTARYFGRVAIDRAYGGLADEPAEGERIAAVLGDHRTMLLGNHGVLVVAPTVAEAYDDLYYLERACRTLVLAYSTGQPLRVLPDAIAEKAAVGWEGYEGFAEAHFAESKRLLDASDPTYAT